MSTIPATPARSKSSKIGSRRRYIDNIAEAYLSPHDGALLMAACGISIFPLSPPNAYGRVNIFRFATHASPNPHRFWWSAFLTDITGGFGILLDSERIAVEIDPIGGFDACMRAHALGFPRTWILRAPEDKRIFIFRLPKGSTPPRRDVEPLGTGLKILQANTPLVAPWSRYRRKTLSPIDLQYCADAPRWLLTAMRELT